MPKAPPISPTIKGTLEPTLSIKRPNKILAGVLVMEYKPNNKPDNADTGTRPGGIESNNRYKPVGVKKAKRGYNRGNR